MYAMGGAIGSPDEQFRIWVLTAIRRAYQGNTKDMLADMGVDAPQGSKWASTGAWPLWRLLRLNDAFWRAMLPWLAERVGQAVVDKREALAVRAVIAVAHALDATSPEDQARVVRALLTTARCVDARGSEAAFAEAS